MIDDELIRMDKYPGVDWDISYVFNDDGTLTRRQVPSDSRYNIVEKPVPAYDVDRVLGKLASEEATVVPSEQ